MQTHPYNQGCGVGGGVGRRFLGRSPSRTVKSTDSRSPYVLHHLQHGETQTRC